MFKRPLIVGFLFLAGILCAAEKLDSLKVGSRTYRDVSVIGANETDLYFTHADGIANVKLRNLSPDLQKKFHFDPKVAAEAENRRIQEDSMFQRSVAEKAAAQATRAAAVAPTPRSSEVSVADPLTEASLLDKPAPQFKFGKWNDEPPPLENRTMLLYFYAPWSIPCRKAADRVTALRKKFTEQMSVVGIQANGNGGIEGESEVKVDFPSTVDADAKLAKTFGITSVPSVVLVDAKGVVRYIGHPAALTEENVQKLLVGTTE